MSGHYFSMFDMAIAGVPAIAFAVWQLVSVNREIARDRASKERAGHAIGEHREDERGRETP